MGDLSTEDALARFIAKHAGMVVVSVDYRLAPQHSFPIPLEDCVEAVEWSLANARRLGSNTGKVIIGGGSAGGNLAIASALKLIEKGNRQRLQGLIALVPVTVHPDCVPSSLSDAYRSYDEEAECPIDTADAMRGPGGFWGTNLDCPRENRREQKLTRN